ncbi:MAG: KH domain-containing protein [Deltaproteobacteria bacterium]|jgi:predicted RNA-binding protein YlqC (UPF0109 family)|nr:KH domain-containing protein [Deltaproteobacteria bacterium]
MLTLVQFLVSNLVSHPAEVQLQESEDSQGQREILLTVHPADLCSIIGKNGRTIRAVRTLMAIAAAKNGGAFVLKVDTGLD